MEGTKKVIINDNNDLKFRDTMKLSTEDKKKLEGDTIEDLEEWTETPPDKNLELFTE